MAESPSLVFTSHMNDGYTSLDIWPLAPAELGHVWSRYLHPRHIVIPLLESVHREGRDLGAFLKSRGVVPESWLGDWPIVRGDRIFAPDFFGSSDLKGDFLWFDLDRPGRSGRDPSLRSGPAMLQRPIRQIPVDVFFESTPGSTIVGYSRDGEKNLLFVRPRELCLQLLGYVIRRLVESSASKRPTSTSRDGRKTSRKTSPLAGPVPRETLRKLLLLAHKVGFTCFSSDIDRGSDLSRLRFWRGGAEFFGSEVSVEELNQRFDLVWKGRSRSWQLLPVTRARCPHPVLE